MPLGVAARSNSFRNTMMLPARLMIARNAPAVRPTHEWSDRNTGFRGRPTGVLMILATSGKVFGAWPYVEFSELILAILACLHDDLARQLLNSRVDNII